MNEIKDNDNVFNFKFSKAFVKSLYKDNLINLQEYEGTIKSLRKIYNIQDIED